MLLTMSDAATHAAMCRMMRATGASGVLCGISLLGGAAHVGYVFSQLYDGWYREYADVAAWFVALWGLHPGLLALMLAGLLVLAWHIEDRRLALALVLLWGGARRLRSGAWRPWAGARCAARRCCAGERRAALRRPPG